MNEQAWYSKQLFAALMQGHSWSLNKLLKKATIEDLNQQDEDGNTALIWAARNNHTAIATMLLSVSGVNVNAQSNTSKTALDYAETKGVKKLLRSLTFQPMTQGCPTAVSATTVAPDTTTATCSATAAAPATIAADAPKITHTTSAPEHSSWLAARLLHSGYGIDTVKDCEKIIVIKEGFVQEGDWLECPHSEFNRAYLTSIGITGLGLQRHL
eukprot:gene8845-10461_t